MPRSDGSCFRGPPRWNGADRLGGCLKTGAVPDLPGRQPRCVEQGSYARYFVRADPGGWDHGLGLEKASWAAPQVSFLPERCSFVEAVSSA